MNLKDRLALLHQARRRREDRRRAQIEQELESLVTRGLVEKVERWDGSTLYKRTPLGDQVCEDRRGSS
jgi:Fe2+ or Zn2+ uptake regulation protein